MYLSKLDHLTNCTSGKKCIKYLHKCLWFFSFQVITGGHYDVDCRLEDPDGIVLYKEMKKQYDSFTFTASRNGTYKFCFSNEFSTFTHKTVYFDFQVGEDPPLFPSENRVTALTQVRCSRAWQQLLAWKNVVCFFPDSAALDIYITIEHQLEFRQHFCRESERWMPESREAWHCRISSAE